jgi:DNA-binding NarL/FixJ family response regulator
MSGIDLADRVQTACPDVKVLYMSGYSNDLVVRSGIPSGESELLSKPFSVDALRLRVRAVIDAFDSGGARSKSA